MINLGPVSEAIPLSKSNGFPVDSPVNFSPELMKYKFHLDVCMCEEMQQNEGNLGTVIYTLTQLSFVLYTYYMPGAQCRGGIQIPQN